MRWFILPVVHRSRDRLPELSSECYVRKDESTVLARILFIGWGVLRSTVTVRTVYAHGSNLIKRVVVEYVLLSPLQVLEQQSLSL